MIKKYVRVTSWADSNQTPDLNSGRWVQIGNPSLINYWLTGLPGGKFYLSAAWPFVRYEKNKSTFKNHVTALVNVSNLCWPNSRDGWIKGLLGQRQIV